MAANLNGRTIAFLATDGVEQIELTEPLEAVRNAGGDTVLVSLEAGEIQGFNHLDKGDTFQVQATVDGASASDYDGLVIPGGVANPDFMRLNEDAVRLVREFIEAGKPVGAICHAPWMLVEADVVRGKRLTSFPSLRTDIRNAGGDWVDEQVVVDRGLTTSRKPDDLPAFCDKIVEELAEGRHEELAAHTAAADQASDAQDFAAGDAQ